MWTIINCNFSNLFINSLLDQIELFILPYL